MYMNLRSNLNHGLFPKMEGLRAIVVGTLKASPGLCRAYVGLIGNLRFWEAVEVYWFLPVLVGE